MKFYSEFIIYFEDIPMPEETKLCPMLWELEDFDSDGDFYYDSINGRWTELDLESRESNELDSKLTVLVYREFDRNYDPGLLDTIRLRRFIDYKESGGFSHNEIISNIKKPAIASFQFETFNQDHYKDFLETVHYFLEYTKGCLVNYMNHNADEFAKDFLR